MGLFKNIGMKLGIGTYSTGPLLTTPNAHSVDHQSTPIVPSRPARYREISRVFDGQGQARDLSDLLNRGGEGKVYPLATSRGALVKIYLPHVLAGPRAVRLRQKLDAMRGIRAMSVSPLFGWPRAMVFDQDRRWIGFAMRRVSGVQLQTLCQPQLIAERLPHWTRRHVLGCALRFVELVNLAHRQNVILGDVNPGNFLIDPDTCEVRGIDCDSYQVRSNGEYFPCPVGVPMLMAPELLDCDFGTVGRTIEQESFSVAIMLFRMFLLGLHPYSRTYGEDPVANLKSGQCALGIGAGNRLPAGPWYNIWSHLPHYIKTLFIKTFRDGNRNPAERTTIAEWQSGLKRYLADMDRGWFDRHMVPQTPKSSEYRGNKSID